MWSKEVSVKTSASRREIWKLWTDVSNWSVWDDQVIASKLNGTFEIGQVGELVPKGGPKSNFELVEVSSLKSFTSRSKLPLGRMDFIHELNDVGDGLMLTHRIEISGPLSFIFSRVIGNNLVRELPTTLDKLSKMAKKQKV